MELPARWNGDLLLYSHGYRAPGANNTATVAPSSPDLSDALRVALLECGYALAGSAYRSTGWAVQDALDDQVRLVDWFDAQVGRPRHTYAWGNSMGGLTSVLLGERNPRRFTGVLALCGDLAGPVAEYNSRLDLAYAIKTLLAPDSDLQIARINDGDANKAKFDLVIGQALRAGPAGQARLSLANALADIPGWFDAHAPAPTAVADQVLAQYLHDAYVIGAGIWGSGRAELERRAGGNLRRPPLRPRCDDHPVEQAAPVARYGLRHLANGCLSARRRRARPGSGISGQVETGSRKGPVQLGAGYHRPD